jgi:A/G-specific adenine glycosylase
MFDHQKLSHWFQRESRDLPWRINPTPYAVWISEVMLQQTQVAVVIPYFERWMQAFPSIEALAKASLDEVIKLWEGLGYYSRARNLHEGARFIIDHFDGQLPANAESLSKIKGIGEYTTGAILSFAFQQRFPAVDGNVIRVLARYFMIEEDISKVKTQRRIREAAWEILPEKESWVITEALIELGATVCKRKPDCRACPLSKTCKGYLHGAAERLPFKSSKTTTQNLFRAVAVIESEDYFLVRKVDQGKIMSGLHEFPYFDISDKGIDPRELLKLVEKRFCIKATHFKNLPPTSHSFTRFNVRLFPFHLQCSQRFEIDEFKWMTLSELKQVAFPSGHRKIVSYL